MRAAAVSDGGVAGSLGGPEAGGRAVESPGWRRVAGCGVGWRRPWGGVLGGEAGAQASQPW